MVSCAVLGCNSTKKNNPRDYSFHQFPINPALKEKWLRTEHSTTHQLARVLHDIAVARNKRERVVAVFLDMEKAFDRVWHTGLVYKLSTSTTPRRVVRIVATFLQDRRFQVAVESALSTERPIRAGVPDITILGLSNLNTMQRFNLASKEKSEEMDWADDEERDFLISLPCENTHENEIIKNVVQYISGYIVKVLHDKLKCDDCVAALYSQNKDTKSLIFSKDKGGLIYPSKDLINLCLFCENVFRDTIRLKKPNKKNLQIIVTRTIYNFMFKFSCLNDHCFPSLNDHMYDQDPINNHKYLLLKLIIEKFFNIRIKYDHKLRNIKKDNIRQFYNKIIIFKGT